MANAVIMPKSGISVESCIIGEWKVKVGDAVKVGDILFTYETDKSSFECESTEAGEVLEIFFNDGDEVPCLTNVCAIGDKVRVMVKFRGRQLSHTELGIELLKKFEEACAEKGSVDKQPAMEGRSMIMFLSPIKPGKVAKPKAEKPTE